MMSRTKARKATKAKPRGGAKPRRTPLLEDTGCITDVVQALDEHHELTPRLTGGDVDADWMGAESSGDEAVGGSVATPDQDVVDELGRALGVEQDSDAEVQTSGEILRERDRHRWTIEREVAREAGDDAP
jgi:hypothetical protein